MLRRRLVTVLAVDEQRSGGGSGRLELQSDLWLDQPDAHERIEERLAHDLVSAERPRCLHGFVDDGYLKFPLGLDEEFCAGFDAKWPAIWEERPTRPRDLAAGPGRTDVSPTTTGASAISATASPTCTGTPTTRSTSTSIRRSSA